MRTSASWAPAPDLNVTAVEPGEQAWIVSVDGRDAEQGRAYCPVCGTQSSSRHSSYLRMLRDLSAQGKPVNIQVRSTRWRCRNHQCDRRIFAERLAKLATPFARRTTRLARIVKLFGHGAGGRPSERLMASLGMPVGDGSGTELGVGAAVGYDMPFESEGWPVMGAKWTILVETMGADGATERIEIGSLERDLSSPAPDDLGLRLAEAKDLLLRLQSFLAQDHVRRVSAIDRTCHCGSRRRLHDYCSQQVATLFGRVTLRQPRWRPCECDSFEAQPNTDQACRQSRTSAQIGGRATSELVRVQAELGARLSFREAARVMSVLLPTGKAANHTGIRRRLARTADRLQFLDNATPHRMSRAHGGPMVVALDGAHIRAIPGFQVRHFEVTVGRVETERQQARHFAVAPSVATPKSRTIGNALRSTGWLPGREVTVLSDGDPALSDGDPALIESVRSAAGDRVTHILDWFHVSMRVRHVEQALAGLLASDLEQKGPLRYVDFDVSRLRHLIWNGYGDEARRALRNITDVAANAIWLNAQHGKARVERFIQLANELRTYLTLNDAALVDYGRRYRAGLRIATSGAESVVNSLVNARMNKRRQMRWSPQGAHRVLQVRAAIIDRRLRAGQLNLAA